MVCWIILTAISTPRRIPETFPIRQRLPRKVKLFGFVCTLRNAVLLEVFLALVCRDDVRNGDLVIRFRMKHIRDTVTRWELGRSSGSFQANPLYQDHELFVTTGSSINRPICPGDNPLTWVSALGNLVLAWCLMYPGKFMRRGISARAGCSLILRLPDFIKR